MGETPTSNTAIGYSRPVDRALGLAAIVHRSQTRKGTAVPYVIHPFHVALILSRHGLGEQFVIAALLHDVLEDIDVRSDDVRESLKEAFPGLADAPDDASEFVSALDRLLAIEFGDEVLRLVHGVTDKKDEGGRRLGTPEKRALKLRELRDPATPDGVLVLKAADAIHNANSTANDLAVHGYKVMERFKTSPTATLQWYKDIRDVASARVGEAHPALIAELTEAVRALAHELARLENELRNAEKYLDI
jgi:(p)ppGpp synthase/HD superfamily hydrolase